MDPDKAARRGRLNTPGCRWDISLVREDLAALRRIDRGAWAKFIALMADSEEHGLTLAANGHDYRAPIGDHIRAAEFGDRPMPWLGELRVQERTPKHQSPLGDEVHHRLYFGEPHKPSNAVVAVSMGDKHGQDPHAGAKQTHQIADAMWKLIHWCESRVPKTGWRSSVEGYGRDG